MPINDRLRSFLPTAGVFRRRGGEMAFVQRPRTGGFTLLEVMVTVVIIAIIATLAFPSYQSYVSNAKRAEGKAELVRIMNMQERYYTNQFPPQYTFDLTDLGLDLYTPPGPPQRRRIPVLMTENDYYGIVAEACGGNATNDFSCVQLTAAASYAQGEDLRLDSLGNKGRREQVPGARWLPGWD